MLTDFGSAVDDAHAVAIDAGGRIVVVGSSSVNGERSDFAVARYDVDGGLDASFGVDGTVTMNVGQPNRYGDQAHDNVVALQSDGRILVVGRSYQGDSTYGGTGCDFWLARYNRDGSLDGTFGIGGKVAMDLGLAAYDSAEAVAVNVQGDIFVAGYTYVSRRGRRFCPGKIP